MARKYYVACILLGVFALTAGAHAAPITFTANLSGAAESPPVASAGTGQATVVFDPVAMTLSIDAWFSGLTGTTTVAHIHCCTAEPGEGNVGVATSTPSFPGFPAGVQAGSYTVVLDLLMAGSWNPSFVTFNGGTFESAAAALGAGLMNGTSYFNIHTTFAPGGEIRGFLTTVPEPGTLGLACLGLAGMLLRHRRKGPVKPPA